MSFAFRVVLVAVAVSLLDFLVFILAEWYGMSYQGLVLEGVLQHILRTILTWWILPPLLVAWTGIFLVASYLANRVE